MKTMLLLTSIVLCGCAGSTDPDASADSNQTPTEATSFIANDTATFAGGCFWCIEAVFERVKGVVEVVSGYSGGMEEHPTYEQVGSGLTGHAESVQIYFDTNVVRYHTLLDVFFHSHDPTQADGQHPDYGRQYRSAIFYHDHSQLFDINAWLDVYDVKDEFDKPIVTEISAFTFFVPAEAYHQNYFRLNPDVPYVQQWTVPKVQKFKKLYPGLYFEPAAISD